MCNKKLNPIVTELFNRGSKPKNYLAFVTQSYSAELQKYWTKFHALFYYENFEQTRTWTNY